MTLVSDQIEKSRPARKGLHIEAVKKLWTWLSGENKPTNKHAPIPDELANAPDWLRDDLGMQPHGETGSELPEQYKAKRGALRLANRRTSAKSI